MTTSIDEALIKQTIAFHGHTCPGVIIGIRAVELAFQRLPSCKKDDLVAVVETDMCGVDAIQYIAGCTLGKGNLIHKDYGKMAFTFYDRKKGMGFRAVLRPDLQNEGRDRMRGLMKKINDGTASEEDRRECQGRRKALEDRYRHADLEDMFMVTGADAPAPRAERVLESLCCDACREMTMESRTRRFDGKTLCIPCFMKVEQKS
ncbi:MAG: FmdE family protein [Pseudomonadota bacterium]